MLSTQHEGLISVFRQSPKLAADLLGDALGIALPDHREVRIEDSNVNNLKPAAFRADGVFTFRDGDRPVHAVVLEVQRGKDKNKKYSWPVYLATVRDDQRCPVTLLVISPDDATASWCAEEIKLGHPGLVLRPLVVGPKHVQALKNADEAAANPELAVLSVALHAQEPQHQDMLDALSVGLSRIEKDLAAGYSDIVLSVLPEAARSYWENLVTTETFEYQTEHFRRAVSNAMAEGRAEGEVKGTAKGMAMGRIQAEAEDILLVLETRGFAVPDDVRARITSCTDVGQLRVWLRRAVTVDSINDIFH